MRESAYSAAQAVASKVHGHYVRHRPAAHQNDWEIAHVPDIQAVETLIDVAFWASLRREEGYVPKISLALLSPDQAARPLMFERPLPLSASPLAGLAPAVERP